MSEYMRWRESCATYFFTVVTAERRSILGNEPAIALLRAAVSYVQGNHPFDIPAADILPDHLHMIWSLPPQSHDFPTRWRLIKSHFTRAFVSTGGTEAARSESRTRHAERAVWQGRYWEHLIRDDEDFERHMDYIHYNPVKHGHARCPHAWPWSSFARCVRDGLYERDWGCECRGAMARPAPRIAELVAGE